jgi:CubicO group peptidase (beta-lactamase class C family)
MHLISRSILSAACLLIPLGQAPSQTVVLPDKARLRAIPDRMREFVSKQEVPGVVTLVATPDRIIHLEAVGYADPAHTRPMRTDAIFWIASMTKLITSTSVMMLHEQGKLSIEDPVGKYIPELASFKTADGKPAKVTLRHLLTHTSGMAEATPAASLAAKTLADLIPAFAAKPLVFEPGSKWAYCQSGMNTLGRIVEVVSGLPLPEFFQKNLLGPLGMKDTAFYLTEKQSQRTVTPARLEDGKLVQTSVGMLNGHPPTWRDHYPAANGGLFSTATDYSRFARMLLNGGTLDGKRYLSPDTVRLMTTIQTGDLVTGFTPGNGWGLGFGVVREPQGVTATLSPGTFGHGGAYGTQAWIDPQKRLVHILMVQRSNFPNGDGSVVRQGFHEALWK